ncbi:MAG: FkbM family methyltransferase [Erythrobacter sp.]|jgi:FkbM family methyltransferase|nr:FkbM family methyltransferase [Erythrobacter sp.]
MSAATLVNPVIVCRSGDSQRLRDRVMPTVLRGFAVFSSVVLGGKAIGLACTLVARLLGDKGVISFRLADGSTFTAGVTDRYWLYYLLLHRRYEPDIDSFLFRALKPQDSFLDCGANLGFWSIAASSVIKNKNFIVAVEASSRTFSNLERNWKKNGERFTIRCRAIGIRSGEELSFFSSATDHASASLIEQLSPEDAIIETVTTISVADLVADQRVQKNSPDALVFVKLDVEGMERDVFSALDPKDYGDLIIIYEDHGSETQHVTGKVLEMGYSAIFMGDDGTLEPILPNSLSRLDELKTDAAKGYNLLAFAPDGPAANRVAAILKS